MVSRRPPAAWLVVHVKGPTILCTTGKSAKFQTLAKTRRTPGHGLPFQLVVGVRLTHTFTDHGTAAGTWRVRLMFPAPCIEVHTGRRYSIDVHRARQSTPTIDGVFFCRDRIVTHLALKLLDIALRTFRSVDEPVGIAVEHFLQRRKKRFCIPETPLKLERCVLTVQVHTIFQSCAFRCQPLTNAKHAH